MHVETSRGRADLYWDDSPEQVRDPTSPAPDGIDFEGYRVYFGTQRRSQAAYTDSIDAGNAATASRCGLPAGTYYFAVRSYSAVGAFSGYSSEVSLVAQGADLAPPSISQRLPAPGATGVPLNTDIYFVLTDDKTGVDNASIQLRVNGAAMATTTTPATTTTTSEQQQRVKEVFVR